MNNELFTLFGKVAIKTDEMVDEFDKAKDKAEEASEGIVEKFKNAGKLLVGLIAVDKIIDFGKASIEASATAKAMEAQFEQVFEGLGDAPQKALDKVADNIGALPNRLKPAFNQIGAFAKVAGMDTAQALEFTARASQAAADTAAFQDKSLEEVTETLQSYLKGNYQVADSLGILSTETTRNEEATKMFGKSFKDLDGLQQQEVLLKMYEDANKVSGALGQAARESDGFENVMGNLNRAWQDFLGVVGSPLLSLAIPIIQGLTNVVVGLSEQVKGVVTAYQEWAEKNPELATALGIFFGVIAAGAIGFGIYSSATAIATAVTTAFGAVMTVVTSPITLVIVAIAALASGIYLLYTNWSTVGPMLSQVWTNISTWVVATVTNMVNIVVTWFSNMWTAVTNHANNIKNSISLAFSTAYNTVKQKVIDMLNAVKEWFGKIPTNIKSLWNEAQNFLEGINLYDIGVSIVQGLWNGIKSKWDGMVNWVSNKASGIKDSIAGVLKINSPAKVMIPIGSAVPEGVAVGVDDGWSFIDKSIDNIGNKIANTRFEIPEIGSMDYSINPQVAQTNTESLVMNSFMDTIVSLLTNISNKDSNLYVNGRNLSEEILDDLNYIQEIRNSRGNRIGGLRA